VVGWGQSTGLGILEMKESAEYGMDMGYSAVIGHEGMAWRSVELSESCSALSQLIPHTFAASVRMNDQIIMRDVSSLSDAKRLVRFCWPNSSVLSHSLILR